MWKIIVTQHLIFSEYNKVKYSVKEVNCSQNKNPEKSLKYIWLPSVCINKWYLCWQVNDLFFTAKKKSCYKFQLLSTYIHHQLLWLCMNINVHISCQAFLFIFIVLIADFFSCWFDSLFQFIDSIFCQYNPADTLSSVGLIWLLNVNKISWIQHSSA